MKWFFKVFRHYTGFRGRARRKESSHDSFSKQARLKIAGVTLMVASTVAFVALILAAIFSISCSPEIFNVPALVLLLTASILLQNEKHEKRNNAIFLLSIAILVFFIRDMLDWLDWVDQFQYLQNIPEEITVPSFLALLFSFSIALFALFVFFSPRNKIFTRPMSVLVMVFSGLYLVWQIYFKASSFDFEYDNDGIKTLQFFVSLLFSILFPIACIVLAYALMVRAGKYGKRSRSMHLEKHRKKGMA